MEQPVKKPLGIVHFIGSKFFPFEVRWVVYQIWPKNISHERLKYL